MARYEAQAVGADIRNFHTLATILLRAVGITTTQMVTLLQPIGGRMPANQLQYDRLITQLRSMGHILEQTPGNISEALRTGGSRGAYVTETFHSDGGYAVITSYSIHYTKLYDRMGSGWPCSISLMDSRSTGVAERHEQPYAAITAGCCHTTWPSRSGAGIRPHHPTGRH